MTISYEHLKDLDSISKKADFRVAFELARIYAMECSRSGVDPDRPECYGFVVQTMSDNAIGTRFFGKKTTIESWLYVWRYGHKHPGLINDGEWTEVIPYPAEDDDVDIFVEHYESVFFDATVAQTEYNRITQNGTQLRTAATSAGSSDDAAEAIAIIQGVTRRVKDQNPDWTEQEVKKAVQKTPEWEASRAVDTGKTNRLDLPVEIKIAAISATIEQNAALLERAFNRGTLEEKKTVLAMYEVMMENVQGRYKSMQDNMSVSSAMSDFDNVMKGWT